MTYYFGFQPSPKLAGMLDDIDALLDSGKDEPYYPLRNETAQQIARELTDNLLVNLIDVIPNEERKASMKKIVGTIESSTETLLNVLMGKDKNKDVLPTVDFLKNDTIFYDNDGVRHVGFAFDDATAQKVLAGFDAVTPQNVDMAQFKTGLETMNHAVLDHFITRFAATLPLGLIKRKSVPVAKVGINKGLDMAINKIFPQLPDDAMNRLVGFYRPYVVQVN